jgi:tetratricopeptide (TPR) repeat protein
LTGIGIAQFLDRRYAEAVATLLASLQEFPTYAPTYRFLASCYAHMGRLAEAREILDGAPEIAGSHLLLAVGRRPSAEYGRSRSR